MADEKSKTNMSDAVIAVANACKAVALKALTTGHFWQFCFLLGFVGFAYCIKSSDWVKIFEMLLANRIFGAAGWIFSGVLTACSVATFRFIRKIYMNEIDRIVLERNGLQAELSQRILVSSKTTSLLPEHRPDETK